MKYTPRSYQEKIIRHIMSRKRCAVYAGMGLGKTSATLEAIRRIRLKHPKLKTLIIAPLRVAQSTWPDELKKWTDFKGLRVSVVCGSQRQRVQAYETSADIYTINYENIPWLVNYFGDKWKFDLIVVDEATRLEQGFSLLLPTALKVSLNLRELRRLTVCSTCGASCGLSTKAQDSASHSRPSKRNTSIRARMEEQLSAGVSGGLLKDQTKRLEPFSLTLR